MEHHLKRDTIAMVIVFLAIMGVVYGYYVVVQHQTLLQMLQNITDVFSSLHYPFLAISTFVGISSLLGGILGRYIGHRTHQAGHKDTNAQIDKLTAVNAEQERTIGYQAELIKKLQGEGEI